MRIFTAHLHPRKPPVLVPEGFSWGAFIFGPLWLLRHGAWIAGGIALALLVVICVAAPPPLRPPLAFALVAVLGLNGQDLRRWSLRLGRFHLAHVVAARNRDEAFVRLISTQPALAGSAV